MPSFLDYSPELQRLSIRLEDMFPQEPATTSEEARAGRPIQFPPGMKGHWFRHWRHGRTQYCYTPHADVNGNFWTFDVVWTGENGMRKNEVRCAKRSVAKRKAYARYKAAGGR